MRIQNHVCCVVKIIVLDSCSIYLNIYYKINVTISITYLDCTPILEWCVEDVDLRAGLHYGGEGLRSVKNAWPRHGYMRQMVDVTEKN
jgi:hypothetical protein